MHRFMLHNDEIRDAGDLTLSPGQTGVLTGWGVFSTIRVYQGVMFAFERHAARMRHDAGLMQVPFPASDSWIEERLYRLIEANRVLEGTLRVSILRNRGGMFQGPDNGREFEMIGFTKGVNDWGETVKLGLVPNARHAANEFAGVKYLSWAQNLTWYERARQRGLDEMLLLNERGEVAECTSANIFAAKGGEVWTPPLSAGCLPGVTRAVLLEEVSQPGLRVIERPLTPRDLESADEVFITSTTRELLPVVEIEGLRVAHSRAYCDRLVPALRKYVESYVAPRRRAVAI